MGLRDRFIRWLNQPIGTKGNYLSALIAMGEPQWSMRNYQTYAAEAYCGNPYVYRAIRMVAQAIADLTIYAMQKERNEEGERESVQVGDDHPMQHVLARPNGYQSWDLFCEEWVSNMFLGGESFIIRPETRTEILTLNLLRPDAIEIAHGTARGDVTGYKHRTSDGLTVYKPERVAHVYWFNPLDEWRGLSPLSPAAQSVDTNNSGRAYHKALFDNGAVGGVVITSTEGASEAELDVLREQIRLKKSGVRRAGDTWLLPSTQKMEKAAWSPRDSLTPEIAVMTLREVAVALGIDPALLGDSTSKIYANVREARAGLYIDVVLPLAGLLLASLSTMLQDWYQGVGYMIDKDLIDELQESQDGLWTRAISGKQASIINVNEARELLGYERIAGADGETTWADEFYAADGITPLSDGGTLEGVSLLPNETEPTVEVVAQPQLSTGAPIAEPASNTALNGAQITSALDVVSRVAARELPRESGIAMLVNFFNLSPQQAEAIMGSVGSTFFLDEPEAQPGDEVVDLDALSEVESRLEEGDVEGALAAAQKAGLPRRERELAKARKKGLPILKRIVRQLVEHDIAEAMEKV